METIVKETETQREFRRGQEVERYAWRVIVAKEVKNYENLAEYARQQGDMRKARELWAIAAAIERMPGIREEGRPF